MADLNAVKNHFQRLNQYYKKSRIGYDILLWKSKHFGFHPIGKKISEKKAQTLMQDLIGKELNLSEEMLVLDAGCGRGVVPLHLARKFACRIEGIDIVPFEIERAKSIISKSNISNKVNCSVMDYSKTNFKDDYFDAVYTMETLSHSINIKKTLREIFRVLKSKGKIALFEYTIAEDKKFSPREKEILNEVIDASAMTGLKNLRHDKFQKLLEKSGFKNIKAENISENVKPSLNRFKKFAIAPYFLVSLISRRKHHPNLTTAIEFPKMAEKDLIRYVIFTAEK